MDSCSWSRRLAHRPCAGAGATVLGSASSATGAIVLHSPDGRFVGATGPGSYVATLWDTYLQEGHQLANNGAKLAFSADSSFVAMASPEHFAEMWRLPDRSPAHSWRHYAEVWDLDFSPDSTKLITQSKNNVAHVWATGDGAELARLIHNETLRRVRYTGDSRNAVTLSGAGILTLWDTVELRQTRTLGFRLPSIIPSFRLSKYPAECSGLRDGFGERCDERRKSVLWHVGDQFVEHAALPE